MAIESGERLPVAGRRPIWAVGDIHGARARVQTMLSQAGIVDGSGAWNAGASIGVCIGDYFNRGEDGAGVVTWLGQLQRQARASGGDVIALVGNHDVLMYGVLAEQERVPYGEIAGRWLLNGGRFLDLERLTHDREAVEWIRSLPAMALLDGSLFLHSDTTAYLELGTSIEQVNETVRMILRGGDLDRIATLFDLLCRRGELRDPAHVDLLLNRFGGERIVHGHSPIFSDAPAVSPDGRCVNIDGALWESDDDEPMGFIYWPHGAAPR